MAYNVHEISYMEAEGRRNDDWNVMPSELMLEAMVAVRLRYCHEQTQHTN